MNVQFLSFIPNSRFLILTTKYLWTMIQQIKKTKLMKYFIIDMVKTNKKPGDLNATLEMYQKCGRLVGWQDGFLTLILFKIEPCYSSENVTILLNLTLFGVIILYFMTRIKTERFWPAKYKRDITRILEV